MVTEIERLSRVMDRTGLSRSTIYLKVSRGEFPKPIALGTRSVGWLAEEITAWIEARVKQSRTATA